MPENIDITPEMIDNLVNIFKNANSSTSNNNLKKMNAKPNNSETNSGQSNSGPFDSLDIETIMKIKKILDSFNSNDNRDTNLLYSLKPYLRRSRQDKLDQYINILKISQVSKVLKNGNGDSK